MQEDEEGFLYPKVDSFHCIDCGLCEKVCPVIHQEPERRPIAVYAAKHSDEKIRLESSSGGVFSAIAECVLKNGGVVFGARFEKDGTVIHGYTETVDGLAAFRGSKYVQSRVGDTYRQAEEFLKSGREVLFSGTPCQIAGLYRFLRKTYNTLLTVDFICHGVPSPGVWRTYLKDETARQCGRKNSVFSHPINKDEDARIERISFRDKRLGWKKYSFSLTLSVLNKHGKKNTVFLSEPLDKNIFLRGFLSDLYLRPSCYACPVKSLKSGSDFTIADFWGVNKVFPEMDDDKGVSVIIVNSSRIDIQRFSSLLGEIRSTDYEIILKYNSAVIYSVKAVKNRSKFYSSKSSIRLKVRCYERRRNTLFNRALNKLIRIMKIRFHTVL